jgi:hypothetical protein
MAVMAVVFDGGSSVRWHLMVLVMDYDKRTRGRHKHKDRQHNNQPAQ